MTKDELFASIRRERAQLDGLLARVGDARMTEPALEGGRSVKDVLAHISAWEKICLALVRNNRPIQPPAPGEAGPSTDIINQKVYEESSKRPLGDVVADAERSYTELFALVESLSDEGLTAVLGAGQEGAEASPPLGQVISGNSDAHYREHNEQIERWLGSG